MVRAQQPGMRVTEIGHAAEGGVTEANWGRADVLVKPNTAHPNVVVNEYLANRLALALGVPVPVGDIWMDGEGDPHWVVAAVRDRGVDLPPPTDTSLLRVPEELRAMMVCFDTLILNDDRHAENVLVSPAGKAWLIDHDQSLFCESPRDGRVAFIRARRQQRWSDSGALWRAARPSHAAIHAAASKMRLLAVDVVSEASDYLRGRRLMTLEDRGALLAVLTWRRDNLLRLVDRRAVRYTEVELDGFMEPGR